MSTALMKKGREHRLENVSVKTPCFCSHCGHLIPILADMGECLQCTGKEGDVERIYTGRLWDLFT
jgi:hypothetical protein